MSDASTRLGSREQRLSGERDSRLALAHGRSARVLCARLGGWALLAGCALLVGCGTAPPPEEPRILEETPADEVLRVGHEWQSVSAERGLLSPPSEISVFSVREESRIELAPKAASEILVIDELLEMRTGAKLRCRTEFRHNLVLRWGRRHGEAALQLTRPALDGPRRCDGLHPEPRISRPRHAARFVLRVDDLVAVEPPLDQRVYRPVP